jgi:hypothetical protein
MNASDTVKFDNVMEMVGFLKTNGTSCRFISMLTETTPKLKKTCPFASVKKISRRRGWLNINFNTSVRRNIAEALGVKLSEVEYENGDVWYKHLLTADGKSLPVVVNKKTPENGKYYIQYFPRTSDTVYEIDGETWKKDEGEKLLQPFLYAKSERDEYKPVVCSISLENVKQLKASGIIIETAENVSELEQSLLKD